MISQKYVARVWQRDISLHQLELPRSAQWASMGSGKTAATLSSINALQFSGDMTKPALVLAPYRVAQSTWPDEVAKWDHLTGMSIVPIVGSMPERYAALGQVLRGGVAVATMNYENLPWLIETLDGKWPFGLIVSDEATRLKSFRLGGSKGVRARALVKVAHLPDSRFWELTGTPSPNGLQDLWGPLWMLDRGERLGKSFTAFSNRWFRVGFNGFGLEPMPYAEKQIHDRLQDICLTVDVRDHMPIDAPIFRDVIVKMPAKARAIYDDMESTLFAELPDGTQVESFNAASRTIRCLQLCNGAMYADETGRWVEVHDQKLQALESIIGEAGGAPILVAYHFKSDLARLQKAFPKGRVLDKDPQTIRDWNAGKISLLFAHPASAGHGISLQDGGNILVFFSHWWALEERMQIIERIGPVRQMQAGHNRPVFVYNIVAEDTVDEIVVKRMDGKTTVQEALLEAMKNRAAN